MRQNLQPGKVVLVELSNGENFRLTEETTQKEMMLAQSRCVCAHLVNLK
jgi:hypothetical protein